VANFSDRIDGHKKAQKSQKFGELKPFSRLFAPLRGLIFFYHAVARTIPGYGHKDVAEVILCAE
jgi:hypothetical protein